MYKRQSCGRELCCSTWLSDFKSVNTQAARYQNLSINQSKLSGQCGRLKCCLNYELDTYIDALQQFPNDCDALFTNRGKAILQKKDIFKNLMWYSLPESNKLYPMSIETVLSIKEMNRQGQKPDELETTEVDTRKPKEIEPAYADLVGQISLRSLEKTTRRRKEKEKRERQDGQGNAPQQNRQRSPRPDGKGQQPQQGERQKQRPPRSQQPCLLYTSPSPRD